MRWASATAGVRGSRPALVRKSGIPRCTVAWRADMSRMTASFCSATTRLDSIAATSRRIEREAVPLLPLPGLDGNPVVKRGSRVITDQRARLARPYLSQLRSNATNAAADVGHAEVDGWAARSRMTSSFWAAAARAVSIAANSPNQPCHPCQGDQAGGARAPQRRRGDRGPVQAEAVRDCRSRSRTAEYFGGQGVPRQ